MKQTHPIVCETTLVTLENDQDCMVDSSFSMGNMAAVFSAQNTIPTTRESSSVQEESIDPMDVYCTTALHTAAAAGDDARVR
jgi:hypothetical protein